MPRGDGTGPAGMGPMTGRGAGFCAGYDTPGYANPIPGRGFGGGGRGRGGRGWRHGFYATGMPGWQRAAYYPQPVSPEPIPYQMTKERELETLKNQLKYQEDILSGLQKRIAELESQPES